MLFGCCSGQLGLRFGRNLLQEEHDPDDDDSSGTSADFEQLLARCLPYCQLYKISTTNMKDLPWMFNETMCTTRSRHVLPIRCLIFGTSSQ